MIAIIVITVIINVVLCVIYHCYPKYEENANIKRKLT